MFKEIALQLRQHAPFTVLGTLSGIIIMAVIFFGRVPASISETLFWGLHPIHVLLSALATAAMYRLHSRGDLWRTILIGYLGAVIIATLSDSIIPYVSEWLLDMPNRGMHIGFIEKWWLVNPLALAGAAIAWVWPRTRFPHLGHVLLSTWASLFHITMAMGTQVRPLEVLAIMVFLFLAVWIPCCTSDIVFPLLWVGKGNKPQGIAHNHS
jgi:hypothetical protein